MNQSLLSMPSCKNMRLLYYLRTCFCLDLGCILQDSLDIAQFRQCYLNRLGDLTARLSAGAAEGPPHHVNSGPQRAPSAEITGMPTMNKLGGAVAHECLPRLGRKAQRW